MGAGSIKKKNKTKPWYDILYMGVCPFKIKDNSDTTMTISWELPDFTKF